MPKNDSPGCLLAIFKLFGISLPGESTTEPESLPYQRKDFLLTKAERSFFDVLQNAVGQRYRLFAMVRLADLIYIRRGTESRQKHFNRIQSKHIDFVLCDNQSIRPLLAIELDDSSHNRPDRQDRDFFVDAALAAAGLPLLRVPAKAGYHAEELAQSIEGSISSKNGL